MTAAAVLSARGGEGETKACATGGGGGGGSGGALLVRAGVLLAAAGATAVAPGGMGRGDAACLGGNGGKGRIRLDRGNQATIDADPAAFLGAAPVAAGLEPIVNEAVLALPVRGEPDESYQLFVNGGGPMAFSTDGDGSASPEVTLEPGLNRLCVQAAGGANLEYPESTNCVDVAYIEP
jgi:hypothetical protein